MTSRLENAFLRPRSQFVSVRTSQPANDIFLEYGLPAPRKSRSRRTVFTGTICEQNPAKKRFTTAEDSNSMRIHRPMVHQSNRS